MSVGIENFIIMVFVHSSGLAALPLLLHHHHGGGAADRHTQQQKNNELIGGCYSFCFQVKSLLHYN